MNALATASMDLPVRAQVSGEKVNDSFFHILSVGYPQMVWSTFRVGLTTLSNQVKNIHYRHAQQHGF